MRVNKYQLDWQIIRLRARSIKDVQSKVDFVQYFFMTHKSKQTLGRVLNWCSMAKLGYSRERRKPFIKFEAILNKWADKVKEEKEEMHNFSDYQLEELRKLHKDLGNRKWGFVYQNKAPVDHIEFMAKLEEYING